MSSKDNSTTMSGNIEPIFFFGNRSCKKSILGEIRTMRSIAVLRTGLGLDDLNPEMKCFACGDKLGWHHANLKWNGKTLVCYGIGCLCEGFKL